MTSKSGAICVVYCDASYLKEMSIILLSLNFTRIECLIYASGFENDVLGIVCSVCML